MYVIIKDQGQQYRVEKGQVLDLARRPAEPGQEIELDQVLLLHDGQRRIVGQPTVPNAHVVAQVLSEEKGRKVTVFKYKASVRYRRLRGHRQRYCRVKITDIRHGGVSVSPEGALEG